MSALDSATALHAEPQFKAFFHVIGAGESNERLDDAAYRICNAGPPLTEWAHPWYGKTTTEVGHSTAAGAFQFLGTSWKECSDALGLGNDFSPANQRLACVWTIDQKRRAAAEVMAGDMAGALAKLKDEWVSLPTMGVERMRVLFAKYGGILSGSTQAAGTIAEPEPTKEAPMGAGLVIGLVQAALQAFAPLAQAKIQQEIGRHSDQATAEQVAQNVMGAIQQATGQIGNTPDKMIAATAAITAPTADKAVVQAAQDDALARLDRLAPFIDKLAALDKAAWDAEEGSRDSAAARAHTDTIDLATPLTYAGLGAFGLLVTFIGVIIIVQVAKNGNAATESWAAFTGAVGWVTGQVSLIYAYRFGTTRSSGAKDVLISELARK